MLSADQAREQLTALRIPDWAKRRAADLSTLPPHLQEIGLELLDLHLRTKSQTLKEVINEWAERENKLEQAAERLDGERLETRARFFEALFPRIGIYVARAWDIGMRLPYQTGWSRSAFRAPQSPITSRRARAQWVWDLLGIVWGYEQDIRWWAMWAPYLGGNASHTLGLLLAAAIETGGREGKEVFEILRASAAGTHDIGAMGRHVIRALLIASKPEGWSLIERLLLTAQRQEGLRQVILESVDEAHPEAFRRLLRTILEHNLVRFSSVVRAVNVWFKLEWTVEHVREVKKAIRQVLEYLEDPLARQRALKEGEGRAAYLALWVMAFEDAVQALESAKRLLKDPNSERRFASVYLLGNLGILGAQKLLRTALEDSDWRITAWALRNIIPRPDWDDFERLERLISRLPRAISPSPILWPWCQPQLSRSFISDLLVMCLGSRPLIRLLPYLPYMSSHGREQVAYKLAEMNKSDPVVRQTLLKLLGDPSAQVRAIVLKTLKQLPPLREEIPQLEALLNRKSGDLRQGIIQLLLNQEELEIIASARRLIFSGHPLKRRAGLELLRHLIGKRHGPEPAIELLREFIAANPRRSETEDRLISEILFQMEPPTLDNALGLMDPTRRTPPAVPRIPERPWIQEGPSLITPAAEALIRALDEWIHQHRSQPLLLQSEGRTEQTLLGDSDWRFPRPNPHLPRDEDLARAPLREQWETWWRNRPANLQDADGLELLRALGAFFSLRGSRVRVPFWKEQLKRRLFGDIDRHLPRYPWIAESLLLWQLRSSSPENAVEFLLDALECTLALLPPEALVGKDKSFDDDDDWRLDSGLLAYLNLARLHRELWPAQWSAEHHIRLWRLLRWMDEPAPGVPRHRPLLEDVLHALKAGGVTKDDLLDYLLGPRGPYDGFHILGYLSRRNPPQPVREHPILMDVIKLCRERIVEIEQSRGDLPTAASRPACFLQYSGDMEVLIRLLRALGSDPLIHRRTFDELNRAAVLSHLIRVTFPSDSDTPEAFAERMRESSIPPRKWIELAVFAPQWARHVAHALGRPGLEEAIWWIHAHTKDRRWNVPAEIRDAWQAEIAERTPISAEDLLDGAVDVAWFQRAYHVAGPEVWKEIYEAAKFASGGSGHRRAQLFADALLGRIPREELIRLIREKRNLDAVLALSLLPLTEGEARDQDLRERYRVLQEFARSGQQVSAMRREKEKRAVDIALQNLARTAGYADPIRLQWAMETLEIQDLQEGSQVIVRGDVTIKLAISEWGEPYLTISRGERPLKHIPAVLKKDPQVAHLISRKRSLEQQVSRIRSALEAMMCRGDRFNGMELQALWRHPVLRPMLQQLVLVLESPYPSENPESRPRMGYPVQEGRALQSYDGRLFPIAEGDQLRIAHPYDLFISGEWHLWQRECFLMERIQPFKQIFRELYLITSTEKEEGYVSRRYNGHQVQPRQAIALLNRRGWIYIPGEGARRTFHDYRLSAWVTFLEAPFTPLEVEGLTIDTVFFTALGDWKHVPLSNVPPYLFSEVMRDLDLVVSIAHAGGVDPEATASTIEMRAALIRETCSLLNLTNVRLQGSRAVIEGQLNTYSVHLGSGVVHRMPGGAVCIVPVYQQHRGRLFLPFADDDPKTAEVLSKVLLLARDSEIKDPTILEQLLT